VALNFQLTASVTGGWKFGLYVVFVGIMSKVHTFPLFAIRPLYLTMR